MNQTPVILYRNYVRQCHWLTLDSFAKISHISQKSCIPENLILCDKVLFRVDCVWKPFEAPYNM